MRQITIILTTVLAAALPLLAEPRIQPPGFFHGEEVVVENGEEVWALAGGERTAHVIPVRVVITTGFDPIVDDPGEATGRDVMVPGRDDVVMLMRDVPGIAPGPVEVATWLDRPANDGEPNEPVILNLRGQVYEIWRESAAGADGPMRIILRSGSRVQILSESVTPEMTLWIGWAGDLDRDGLLDLYIELSDHYNISRPTLFLSSLATDGEIVGLAASHLSSGC